MSRSKSPRTSCTRSTSSPFASTTFQPGSMTVQATGSGMSDGPAADVPDGPLRRDRMAVRQRAEHAHLGQDRFLVEPCEAAAHHDRRRPVAEAVRAPEAEPGPAGPAQHRVDRGEQQRRPLDVVRRRQLQLAEQVAPVTRQRREYGVPFGGRRRARDRRLRRRCVRRGELEPPADPFFVDPAQHSPNRFGSDTGAAARRVEADGAAHTPGARRCQERECAPQLRVVVDRQHETGVAPPRIQTLLDRVPLLDEPHRANRTLPAVAKVEEKKGSLRKDELKDVLREMLLIRRFEEKVEERFRAGELPGFLHVAIGQEACAVGVCRALEDGDVIASTHRAHGHTLAKGTHPNELMAELYGKTEGCSHGYGGSMHLYDVEHGNMGANAVIGGGLPHITGAALAFQLRGEPRVALAFFGDGATNIGMFHESLNLAQLWKVPAVFVCENNHWAESTPASQQLPIEDLALRAEAYGMHSITVDGQDVEEVWGGARDALDHARSGEGPVFLLANTYRLTGHYVGDPQVYRDKEELRETRETQDPIDKLRDKLELSNDEWERLDKEITQRVDESVEFAKNGTDPAPEDAEKNVYA